MSLRPHVAPELLSKVTKALGITALDQWYYVSQYAASQAIGARALNTFGDTLGFLKSAYPHHHFEEEKIASRKNNEKDQKFMEVLVRQLFPNTEIHTKARKAVGIINPETYAYLEIDIWIPSLKLGIEYQDKHHYAYQWYANEPLGEYQKRDSIKKTAMEKLGYTLVTIGYWWDKTIESVAATIRKFRPDLLLEYQGGSVLPIPSEPPHALVSTSSVVPGVPGIMSPFIPTSNFDPTNWYAGEKYDGIRGIYNPKFNKIFSRLGKELSVLASLLKDIPEMIVEGEINAGRGNYNKTATVSHHTHHDNVNWAAFRYVLYDIPNAELGNYSDRYSFVIEGLAARPFIFAQSTFRILIENKAHLEMLVDAIISDSGEGMIAQNDTRYEYGRAKGLAKIKVHRDADAQVLRINKRSCTCKLPTGVTAEIIFVDGFEQSKLEIGDIIAYYHHGHSQSGLPVRGEIYKVRYDLSWEQVVRESEQKVAKRRSVKETIGGSSLYARNTARQKLGHWNKPTNVRAFFDKFARKAGFDPLLASENWYSVNNLAVRQAGGAGLLSAYNNSLKKALSCAYPELNLDKFRTQGYWKKAHNVRAFFDEFAQSAGFDPLVPENWYSVRARAVQNSGGGGLMYAHKSNLKNALSFAYPESKFDKQKFRPRASKGHWSKQTNVRAFFDEYARTAGLDPLIAENWYPVGFSTLRNAKGGGLLKAFKYRTAKALSYAYPELKFEENKFMRYN